VVLDDSDVTFDRVTVVGGSGGKGGAGGDGKSGQAGGTAVENGRVGGASSKCGLIWYYSGSGGKGGVGGKGGSGGGGAGGIGGASVAIARVGTSVLTRVAGVTVSVGTSGAGGDPGHGPGTPGAGGAPGGAIDERTY
jgi:hypothetical protein